MELKLGAAIKKYRTEKGITQEELAEYIGISFQAVSKWETNTTLPDIALLPKLAVFFGVSIDDLFSVNTGDQLERIDFMLTNENLTDENFAYAKRTLDSMLRENENDTEAIKRYAWLYLNKNNRDNLAAGRLLEKAISLAPHNDELYGLYRQVRGGIKDAYRSGCDWFIRFCEPFAVKYPTNIKLKYLLTEAYIDMRYFDRAADMISELKTIDDSRLPGIYEGDLELA
jgi:transcriptional regulator with XRE-family HTH domain